MKRVIYHVTSAGDAWRVKRVGARRAASVCADKRKAVAKAKALASKSSQLGQVRVHGSDGDIQTEYTYGADPRRSRG
jgi:hypothetical protein